MGTNASAPALTRQDEARNKDLRKLDEAVQRLKEMSDPEQTAKDRIAFLMARLQELKAMIRNASPELAKTLASQLRGIASQLASAAKSAGGAAPSTAGVVSGINASLSGDSSKGATAAISAVQAAAATQAEVESEAEKAQSSLPATQGADASETPTSSGFADIQHGTADNSLRDLLREAKRMLQESAHMLKSKLRELDDETRRHLHAVDKSIEAIDAAMPPFQATMLYTATGSATSSADLASALGGTSVNIAV